MPQAVPLVAAVAGAGASQAWGTGLALTLFGGGVATAGQVAFAGGLAGAVVATGVNALGSRALARKPKAATFTDTGGRVTLVRSSVESHKIIYGTTRVSGPLAFIKTTDTGNFNTGGVDAGDNKFLHMVVALAGHEVDDIADVYLGDQRVVFDSNGWATTPPYFTPGDGKSYARIRKHLGSPDQAADPDLIAECGLDAAHRLRGIAYLYIRLHWRPDSFPEGIPQVSAVVRGKKVFDPRTGLTAYSDNAALCIRDYLTSRDGSAIDEPYGFGCDASEVDDAYTIAAANVSGEAIPRPDGTSHLRYTCSGVIDTETAPLDNLQQMVTALAGAVTYVQGKFRIHAAAYDSPAGDIALDMLAGEVNVQARTSRKELFNAVKGTYIDPNKGWLATDFPPVTNAIYEAQDGGERISRDLELPFTDDPVAAQRIAKVLLEKGRQGITVIVPVNHSALKFAVYDVVTLTNPGLGWDAKPFRVTRWNMAPPGPITLTLQEEAAASYAWDAGEATAADPAPDTNLPSPWLVKPPKALTVTEEKYVTREGSAVKAKAVLSWLPSQDAFVSAYQPEYRPEGSSDWTALARTTGTSADLPDIQPGTYDFRVKAISELGISSEYSTTSAQIAGLLDAPSEPQNLTVSTIGGLAVLRWDQSPDADVRVGGKIVFRHSPEAAAQWHQTTTIGNAVPGSATHAVLPLKPGVYLAKAVDSTGIESENAASVTTEQATALAYANVTSLDEHPGFSGAKTGLIVDGGALKLAGSGQFDGIADFDAVADLDAHGGTTTAGTYAFSGIMDLGSVIPIRLTSHVVAAVTQIYDQIDSRIDMIDDWLSFDGTDAAAGDAVVYVEATDDNPAGTPTWRPPQRLDSGEFVARAFRFSLGMMVDDATYNIAVTELSVTADEVA